MPDPVVLSEKLLMDTGGWRELKAARLIHGAGKVEEARYANGVLEGLVLDQGKSRKVRVDIKTRTWWDNHCSCPVARRDGAVCSHALAVALQIIEPVSAPASSSPSPPGAVAARPSAPAEPKLSPAWPAFTDSPETPDAIPAQLFVVLAPQIATAWEKGRLLAGIEIAIGDGPRSLLAAAKPGGAPLFLGPRDIVLWRVLQAITPEQVPGMMQLGRSDFLRLLDALGGHPRVTFGKKDPARIALSAYRPPLGIARGRLRVDWPTGITPLIEPAAETAWALDGSVFRPVAPGLPAALRTILDKAGYALEPLTAPAALAALEEAFAVPADAVDRLPRLVAPQVELDLEGSLNHLEATLYFRYPDRPRRPADSPAGGFLPDPHDPERLLLPDAAAERAAVAALLPWGFGDPDARGTLVLKDKAAILRFFAHGFHRLDPAWKITTGQRFDHASRQVEPVTAGFEFTSSGENWFAMELEFTTPGGTRFTREEIQRLLQKGQHSQQTAGGKIAVIDPDLLDELNEAVTDIEARQERPGTFRVSAQHAGYLRQTAAETGVAIRGSVPWETQPTTLSVAASIDGLLRPYQRDGVLWMLGLAARNLGGILADDMGLGKTLQALAFLSSIDRSGSPALVVCPSSLVHNWIDEAAKFTPHLKAVALTGPNRHTLMAASADADLWVTSYALLRLDADTLTRREFSAVILDEAQQIKNPDAQVAKAAHALRARHRLALTGTPIENSVRDLWSVMHFALPGYLGSRKDFSERFEKPIGTGDAATRRRLARRLQPVILRRLKSEVARDLPEKIEQVIHCDLGEEQRAVYDQILRESRATILDAEGNRKRMLALTALLRLRQACCDLRLLGLPDLKPEEASVKLDAVEELIADAVEGGHRVLVFSQFVEMLRVLVPVFAERGWQYAYLDGQTKNRGEVVRRFQERADIPVFLISLKAGGVGLNLTGADTVIHIDPWWNPAVEAQATDRAHRIGQTRVVTSYKLIARGTVEEKILALQERKKETIRAMLDQGEDGGDAALTEAEILELIG
ncbi:MAG: DEAD/DEAH box helicase [Verrucomicrobiales bacterium]|nr:DEAD/DEAH box helicase [Verrucomicrobiales bacterium]